MRKIWCALLAMVSVALFLNVSHAAGTPGTAKWTYDTEGSIASSPAIGSDGTIYVGSRDRNIYALRPTGTLRWTQTVVNDQFSSASIAADGTIYIGSEGGLLYAFNPNGTLKWTFAARQSVRSTPAIGPDGTVYVGSFDGNVYAVNPDGSLKWSYALEGGGVPIGCSPAIGSDGTLYIGALGSNFYALNPDGTLKWVFPTGGSADSAPSIGADGTIYKGSYDHKLYAINPDGSLKWSYNTGGWVHASPVIGADGTIYTASFDGKLYALNPDGTMEWSFTTGDWIASTPAIGADGMIYVGSFDSNLYALNPGGTLAWSYATGSTIDSPPVIAEDGTLYVGSNDGRIHAIYTSSPGLANSSWPMYHRDVRHTGRVAPILTVTKSGSGTGTVTSSPAGIDCGTACTFAFDAGATVSLTPVPEPDSVFTGWTGACSGKGPCSVVMNGNISVGASFEVSSCTYSLSSHEKTLSYKGGVFTVRVQAKDYTYCRPPEIINNTDWITYTADAFTGNRGFVRFFLPERNKSEGRTGTVSIGGNLFTLTQKGEPCTLMLSAPSSAPVSAEGGTGSFFVWVSPDDCAWSAAADTKSPWLQVTAAGSGRVDYSVDENSGRKPRQAKASVSLDIGKKVKSYTVRQAGR